MRQGAEMDKHSHPGRREKKKGKDTCGTCDSSIREARVGGSKIEDRPECHPEIMFT